MSMTTIFEQGDEFDATNALVKARRERAAALAEWNYVLQAIEAVERYGVLPEERERVTRDERTMRASTGLFRRPEGRELDGQVEREVVLTSLRRRKVEAAERLLAAKDRISAALVAVANEKLPDLVADHAQAAERLVAARKAVEQAVLDVVALGITLREEQVREELAARRVMEAALAGAPDNQARQSIKDVDGVPVFLGPDGFVAKVHERPSAHLWTFGADCWRVDTDAFGENIARTIAQGRRRLGDASEKVEQRFIEPIQRRLRKIDEQRNHS
jgi:hypothetical protein